MTKIGACSFTQSRLALAGRQLGVALQQFLRVDEGDLLGQERPDVRVTLVDELLGALEDRVELADDLLEELHVPVRAGDDALPVPLVDVDRVGVVQPLVRADGVHVRVEPIARLEAELAELMRFHLASDCTISARAPGMSLHGEGHRLFDAVQVVVDARAALDEQRGGHAGEVQLGGQVQFEEILEGLDGAFGFTNTDHGR